MEIVKVKKLHADALIPTKAYEYDAGFDLHALEDVFIEPGETIKVRTGLAFELSNGFEMQIRPRSGISTRTTLRVVLGTVDSEYRGEVSVNVDNIFQDVDAYCDGTLDTTDGMIQIFSEDYRKHPEGTYIIRKGDRIAQAVIQKIPHIQLVEVKELGKGARGTNGFGSTGINHEY